ncbi:MAG TPA: hypothetical protein VGH01_09915 [Jatrophihabitantaceae bacterium]|jgi:hypothetical protein
MPNTHLTKQVTPFMLLKNYVFRHVAPRVDWNLVKSKAQQTGVDTAKFNKNLGPELDKLVRSLMAAKAVLARPGGQVDAGQKKTMEAQYQRVDNIIEAYKAIIKAEKHQPDTTAAQRDALESMKGHLEWVSDEYGRLLAVRTQ